MTLRTLPIKTDNYELKAQFASDRVSLALKGTFDMAATPDLGLYLVSIESDIKRLEIRDIVVDVVEVYYLGSSCIKSFVTFVAALKKHGSHPQLRVVTNPRLDWHERTFAVLARLSPTMVTVEKSR